MNTSNNSDMNLSKSPIIGMLSEKVRVGFNGSKVSPDMKKRLEKFAGFLENSVKEQNSASNIINLGLQVAHHCKTYPEDTQGILMLFEYATQNLGHSLVYTFPKLSVHIDNITEKSAHAVSNVL